MRLSGERIPLSDPRPRLQSRPPPADLPPSDRWGLGVWFMTEAMCVEEDSEEDEGGGGVVSGEIQESIILFSR